MSSRAETLQPPSGGTAPRDIARLPGGTTCFLAPLAHAVARRHLDEFPDEAERYGAAGFEWCVHDVQWILTWAAGEMDGNEGLLTRQLTWLGELLEARGYPRERLVRAVHLAAEAVDEGYAGAGKPLADILRAAVR